jgi:uncharacterized protein
MNTNLPSSRSVRRFAAVTAAALIAAVGIGVATTQNAGANVTTTPSSGSGRTVVVDGTGRVSETPDQMILNLGVETRAVRVAEALKANNDAAATINKLLKARGIEARDIQTSGLSIYPQFDNTGRKITAYQVNNSITVKVRNLATSGELIDAVATAAGDAIRINGLSFAVADTSKSAARARELAVGDARTQAEQLAKAAGVRLGALRTIRTSVENSTPSPQGQFAQAGLAKAADTPIEAGSFEISSTVQLVYDIS